MRYSNNNPTVSFYTYVMFDILRTHEYFNTRQDGFYNHVKDEGYDFHEVREELLNTGIVMDLKGMICCSERIFCGELIIAGETKEYIAGEWEVAFKYATDTIIDLHRAGIEAEIKVPLDNGGGEDQVTTIKFDES